MVDLFIGNGQLKSLKREIFPMEIVAHPSVELQGMNNRNYTHAFIRRRSFPPKLKIKKAINNAKAMANH